MKRNFVYPPAITERNPHQHHPSCLKHWQMHVTVKIWVAVTLSLACLRLAFGREQLPPQLPEDVGNPNARPTPSPSLPMETTIVAKGTGTIKVSSPALGPAGYVALIQHFSPRSGVKEPKQFGRLNGFLPVDLPIVFHLTSFLMNNTRLPAYKSFAESTARQMIADANLFYRGSSIKFKFQEARWDTAKYPYLGFKSLFDWQDCLAMTCIVRLAQAHNVPQVINVWISASNEQFGCPNNAVACSMFQANGYTAHSPGSAPASTTTQEQQQQGGVAGVNFSWLNYDRFDPKWKFNANALNNTGESGASVLAHELGHYHGLLHTFQDGCAPINDGCNDTAPNLEFGDPSLPWNLTAAVEWCGAFRKGLSPSVDRLQAFTSCPGTQGIDNIFNLMSYIPGSCRMVFTENQVARMQWALLTYMPDMMHRYAIK